MVRNDELAGLRALLEPATMKVTTDTPPKTRAHPCFKCPFGTNLLPHEQQQANALKVRLETQQGSIWGCHETVGNRPMVCAGFAKWKKENNIA